MSHQDLSCLQVTEMSDAGAAFLLDAFHRHDLDNDGLLSEDEERHLTDTMPNK